METRNCTVEVSPMEARVLTTKAHIVVLTCTWQSSPVWYYAEDDINRFTDIIPSGLINLPPPEFIYNASTY